MSQRIVLAAAAFFASACLCYLASPSWGCGVTAECTVICYNSSGQQIGQPGQCNAVHGSTSCFCSTDYDGAGNAFCNVGCDGLPGEDQFCVF
jgi:hypothetical protein